MMKYSTSFRIFAKPEEFRIADEFDGTEQEWDQLTKEVQIQFVTKMIIDNMEFDWIEL